MNPWSYDIRTFGRKARAVRRRIVRLNANSPAGGHTGVDLFQVRLLTAFYFRILDAVLGRIANKTRGIYIQSKGHTVGCYYCTLAEASFSLVDQLETYQHTNSRLPGHPVRQKTPGIRLGTGVLGHGLPVAMGLALATKKGNSLRRIFLITSDDGLAEGNNWEAVLVATRYGLDNLIIINDENNLQLAGPAREIMNTDPLAARWQASSMTVTECQENDVVLVITTSKGLRQDGRPNVIIANTTRGAGISFIQGRPEWHRRVPKGEETELALEELKDK